MPRITPRPSPRPKQSLPHGHPGRPTKTSSKTTAKPPLPGKPPQR